MILCKELDGKGGKNPVAVDRTRVPEVLWERLSIFLSHTLVSTLIFGLVVGATALMDRVRGWLSFSGPDSVSLVLRWAEFALLGINALLYLVFLVRAVVSSADRILKDMRGSPQ